MHDPDYALKIFATILS